MPVLGTFSFISSGGSHVTVKRPLDLIATKHFPFAAIEPLWQQHWEDDALLDCRHRFTLPPPLLNSEHTAFLHKPWFLCLTAIILLLGWKQVKIFYSFGVPAC